ncbi:MAG: hypothetical protein MZV64_34435 [Ignavibacteriales bacterium]|nr:hypothetical protein [Ignavibacteriales bacterium]
MLEDSGGRGADGTEAARLPGLPDKGRRFSTHFEILRLHPVVCDLPRTGPAEKCRNRRGAGFHSERCLAVVSCSSTAGVKCSPAVGSSH